MSDLQTPTNKRLKCHLGCVFESTSSVRPTFQFLNGTVRAAAKVRILLQGLQHRVDFGSFRVTLAKCSETIAQRQGNDRHNGRMHRLCIARRGSTSNS